MDLLKTISSIRNLNSFISLTQDLAGKNELTQIPLNMSTALALKKMQSFEFEYFSRFQESGLAFMILDHLLKLPPSKTWVLLGKELVPLLLYWLEGLRKYLVNHSQHWWIFLKSLQKYINELGQKDDTLKTALVEYLAEPMLGLATSEKLDLDQRLATLRCLNHCSAGCKRATREALALKFSSYFTTIATNMATCGHVPMQMASTELLLRWLVNRRDRSVREDAARRWLSATLWEPPAVAFFIRSAFKDFFKNVREFLNIHNQTSDSVVSVVCRKMTIGPLPIVSGTERFETWLDVNTEHGCITVLLDPLLLQPLLIPDQVSVETLTVRADSARAVDLYRESSELTVSLQTSRAPEVLSESLGKVLEGLCDIKVHVSSRCDAARLDRALRRVFTDKYKCLLEADRSAEVISPSPPEFPESSKRFSASEDDTRFSNSFAKAKTVHKKRRHLPGCSAFSRTTPLILSKSPSAASGNSLTQLHEKLASLPSRRFEKELGGVCAAPALSRVSELSEPEDFSTSQRRRRSGVLQKSRVKARTSPSDREEAKQSGYVYATIGSIYNYNVNDPAEKNQEAITNLTARQAFANENVTQTHLVTDSGVNTAEDAETAEGGTANAEPLPLQCSVLLKKLPISNIASKCTVVSKSTSDESNTEPVVAVPVTRPFGVANKVRNRIETSEESYSDVINETPRNFVSVRRGHVKKNVSRNFDADAGDKDSAFDVQDIEDFFSQHFRETNNGDLMISPTLARKINENSSETSESFDQYLLYEPKELGRPVNEIDVDPADIADCLSSMIDNVCAQINKCYEFMEIQDTVLDNLQEEITVPMKDILKRKPVKMIKGKPKIKLSSKSTLAKKEPKQRGPKKGKLQVVPLVEKEPEITETLPGDSNKQTTQKTEKKTAERVNKCATKQKIVRAGLKDDINQINIRANSTDDDNQKGTKAIPKTVERNPKSRTKQGNLDAIPEERTKENIPEEKNSDSDTPLLQRRKRKLYSPSDVPAGIAEFERLVPLRDSMDDDDAIPLAELKTNSNLNTPKRKSSVRTTPKSAATSYKDIETDRRKLTKPARRRKSKVTSPVLSPKTLKANWLFDQLKENVENNDVQSVNNRSSNFDIAVYNYTSDSEDEYFKKKKIVDVRRSGTTLCSTDSVSAKGRVVSKVNYTESSADEAKVNKKAGKKGAKRQPVKRKRKKDLVDERMREASVKELDTSIERAPQKHARTGTEVEPVIICAQEMEPMEEVVLEDNYTELQEKEEEIAKKTVSDKNKLEFTEKIVHSEEVPAKKLGKKNSELSLKKNTKNNKRDFIKLTEERSDESLLPALIIEKTAPRQDDDARSTISSNLIKKCNRIIEDGEEFFDDTVTTQNMLSDADKICPALQDEIEMEVCETLNVPERRETKKGKGKPKTVVTKPVETAKQDYKSNFTENKVNKPKRDQNTQPTSVVVIRDTADGDGRSEIADAKLSLKKRKGKADVITEVSSNSASVSISTYGTSRIRCYSENLPPHPDDLTEHVEPRNMELEELSPSMHPYFLEVNAVITEAPAESSISKQKRSQQVSEIEKVSSLGSILSSPKVRLSRLGDDDFRKWLPSPKCSFTEVLLENIDDLPETNDVQVVKPTITKTAKRKHPIKTDERQSKKNTKNTAKTKALDTKKAAEKPNRKSDQVAEKTNKEGDPKQNNAKPEGEPKRISMILPIHLSEGIDDGEEFMITQVQEQPNILNKITEIFSQTKTKQSLRSRAEPHPSSEYSKMVNGNGEYSKASSTLPQSKKRRPQITTAKWRKVQTESDSTTELTTPDQEEPKSQKNSTESFSLTKTKQSHICPRAESSERSEKQSSGTSKESSTRPQSKKRSLSPQITAPKWRKVQTAVSTMANSMSVSSVMEWFTRDRPTKGTEEDIEFACRENLKNVMEKVDTTLLEIHQGTSSKFAKMFVEMQSQQSERDKLQAEQLRRELAASARHVMTQVVQLVSGWIEQQQEQLIDSHNQRAAAFKETTRRMALDIIREDMRQKRAMVTILREDMQAVLDHCTSKRRTQ